jgi:hypothetical protein
VAGGALGGLLVAVLRAGADRLQGGGHPRLAWILDHPLNLEPALTRLLGVRGYDALGLGCFALMALGLWLSAKRRGTDIIGR